MRVYTTTTNPTAPTVRDIEGACCDVVECMKFSSDVGTPNISGRTGIGWNSGLGATTDIGQTGSFKVAEVVDRTASAGGIGDWNYHLDFDASESDSIFGMCSTVQPSSLLLVPCIKS